MCQVKCSADLVLRLIQLSLYIMTIITGFVVSLSLGWTVNYFNGKCLLYSTMPLITGSNNSLSIDFDHTVYGQRSKCDYCIYTSVVAVIYAIMWLWFFVVIGKFSAVIEERDGPPPDRKVLPVTLVFNVALFTACLVSACMITAGFNGWCASVTDSLRIQKCSAVADRQWLNLLYGSRGYTYMYTSVISSWLLVVGLGAKAGVVCLRLFLYWQSTRQKSEEDESALHSEIEFTIEDPTHSFEASMSPDEQVSPKIRQEYMPLEGSDEPDSPKSAIC